MADPFVTWAPEEVGPCTATWFVGSGRGSETNEGPTFGSATESQPVAAWSHLVDGPLKDVLTAPYESKDAAMAAWAKAGGQVDFSAQSADGSPVYTVQPWINLYPLEVSGPQIWWQVGFVPADYPAVALPLRWVVKFSVPHSIIR